MRRPIKSKHDILPDEKYDSELLSRFINAIMLDGKKSTARTVVYDALDEIKNRDNTADPIAVFEMAIQNISPSVEVRSRRVGGANYQVPREVRAERRRSLSFRWIIAAARGAKGKAMSKKLADELVLASKNEGSAIKKKEDVHRMAESNRAFAHLAW
ncbi:30S ribosomal protein S7 [Candidatus Kaiserbacteria bacterium CG10_big_fil_rev_8_21_14_0_10_45_20]|uniref:Small ribosomal subunit protein uS7 n=1 Tax=Candidatus Kaiserbacteria bacterium CG10_big_fil_rev_8_21_14_0_10_45_20 TaxID=1974607 RepID=A0A2H0UFL1_9BACT|nr:MAG: 30S ribosomal protein S7 [Candidatus Kaiserbacteria bacterium CG10_big_fil_rev_8_21_14_0_10_45_20]